MRLPLLAAATLALAAPVLADETWTTPDGQVVYLDEIGDAAIFTAPLGTDLLRIYLPGLAGNYDDRATHEGYFIANGQGDCGVSLTAPDGFGGRDWGRVIVTFDRPAFPTGFTMMIGGCFDTPRLGVRADLP